MFGFTGAHFDNAQLWASRGYAVLWPDGRMEDRDPLAQVPGLVLPAVDAVIAAGIADPDRVGVMGHSYGGYMVLCLLAQTDRFRAALVSAPGCVNITSEYGHLAPDGIGKQGYFEAGLGRMGGTLWERREAYIENSPVFHLDRLHTPLLIICGDADETVPPGQSGELFSGLRRLGREAELRMYEGEGHWPGEWSEQSLRDACERVVAWFGQHLLGEE
jgi:dipeptidyl aminopeptidase/acylaminoacyl peptidase